MFRSIDLFSQSILKTHNCMQPLEMRFLWVHKLPPWSIASTHSYRFHLFRSLIGIVLHRLALQHRSWRRTPPWRPWPMTKRIYWCGSFTDDYYDRNLARRPVSASSATFSIIPHHHHHLNMHSTWDWRDRWILFTHIFIALPWNSFGSIKLSNRIGEHTPNG